MYSELNEKQRLAITDKSSRLLILAGAGSGKTKTLTLKIENLVKELSIPSSEILAITFTKNAANEMIDRLIIKNDLYGNYQKALKEGSLAEVDSMRLQMKKSISWLDKLTISTFHALCFRIMRRSGVKVFDNQFKILADPLYEDVLSDEQTETPSSLMHKSIMQCAAENQEFLLKLKWYLVNYCTKKQTKQTNTNTPRYDNLYTTLRGDKVKSKSEVFIADWLYRHDIEYKYEMREVSHGKAFYPDFYIPAADLYLEHTSNLSQGVEIKKEILRFRHQPVNETHEEEMYDVTAFSKQLDHILRNRLGKYTNGVKLLSVKEAISPYEEELRTFIKQFKTALDLIKVEAQNVDKVVRAGEADRHLRVAEFYSLFKTVFGKYKYLCESSSYLDFNDLVIRAIELLKNNPDVANEYRKIYRYILVDEFQDVNKLQIELLQLLSDNSGLFCVDDWQSIYGFRGSDVDYIVNFSRHFTNSKVFNLELNYRSTQTIVSAGNEVMKNNKFKVEKELHAFNKEVNKINVYISNKESDDGVKYVIKRIDELLHAGLKNEDILILGRRSSMLHPYRRAIKQSGQKVACRTIHSSKGLEARIVIIVGLTEGPGGFPDLWLNDRIYQIIKPQDLELMKEEERRLFYVAITRAKEELILITEANAESSYIKEIPSHFLNRVSVEIHQRAKINACPNCGKVHYHEVNFCSNCSFKLLDANEGLII